MYGLNIASDEASLSRSLTALDKWQMKTPTLKNDSILLQYFKELV
jgi:2-succinyl-5-enolpyruvyl-6-hydroxy-3-cyclohexene-1-carboxylate synthase